MAKDKEPNCNTTHQSTQETVPECYSILIYIRHCLLYSAWLCPNPGAWAVLLINHGSKSITVSFPIVLKAR